MSKAVVTGVAGFIGGHLAQRLLDLGYEVIGIDDYSTGHYLNIPKGVHFWNIDISKKENMSILSSICQNADYIFHLAAKARVQPSIDNPVLYHETNVNGLLNMLEIAREHRVKKFIFSSSSSVVGTTELFPTPEDAPCNPISPYALHKLIGEQYCKVYAEVYGLPTISLRYFNVYGDKMPTEGAYRLVLGIWAKQKKNGEPLTVTGTGYQRRDFTWVGDVVTANILAATSEIASGEVFNIGNGDNRSINDIASLFGHPKVHIQPKLEPLITLANNKKAKEKLGWQPTKNIEDWLPGWLESL
jgi:UDP-glucose 4-epimerase